MTPLEALLWCYMATPIARRRGKAIAYQVVKASRPGPRPAHNTNSAENGAKE